MLIINVVEEIGEKPLGGGIHPLPPPPFVRPRVKVSDLTVPRTRSPWAFVKIFSFFTVFEHAVLETWLKFPINLNQLKDIYGETTWFIFKADALSIKWLISWLTRVGQIAN